MINLNLKQFKAVKINQLYCVQKPVIILEGLVSQYLKQISIVIILVQNNINMLNLIRKKFVYPNVMAQKINITKQFNILITDKVMISRYVYLNVMMTNYLPNKIK